MQQRRQVGADDVVGVPDRGMLAPDAPGRNPRGQPGRRGLLVEALTGDRVGDALQAERPVGDERQHVIGDARVVLEQLLFRDGELSGHHTSIEVREHEAPTLDVADAGGHHVADAALGHAADGRRRARRRTKRSTAATVPAIARPASTARAPTDHDRTSGTRARTSPTPRRHGGDRPRVRRHTRGTRGREGVELPLDHAAGECNVSLDLSWAASHRQFSSKDVSVSVGQDRCVSRHALQVRAKALSSITPPPAISSGSQGAPNSGDSAAASRSTSDEIEGDRRRPRDHDRHADAAHEGPRLGHAELDFETDQTPETTRERLGVANRKREPDETCPSLDNKSKFIATPEYRR